jgi:hypothetical protein
LIGGYNKYTEIGRQKPALGLSRRYSLQPGTGCGKIGKRPNEGLQVNDQPKPLARRLWLWAFRPWIEDVRQGARNRAVAEFQALSSLKDPTGIGEDVRSVFDAAIRKKSSL